MLAVIFDMTTHTFWKPIFAIVGPPTYDKLGHAFETLFQR